jgi:hypothetical protein
MVTARHRSGSPPPLRIAVATMNDGTFNGGPGTDTVATFNGGTFNP